jgi:phosphomannomutase/phosphoglucomutase
MIVAHGGTPLLWKTGHSLIKTKMKEVGAGARLLEIVSRDADPAAVLDALPDALSTPELNIGCAEGEQHALIAKLQSDARFPGATDVIRIDGLRVEYADGFGLARASNTTPAIVMRFEADDAPALARIQQAFGRVLTAAKPGIELPFA